MNTQIELCRLNICAWSLRTPPPNIAAINKGTPLPNVLENLVRERLLSAVACSLECHYFET